MKKQTLVRISFLLLLVGAACGLAVQAQEKPVTVTTGDKWHRNRVDVAYMNKRISDAAEQYKQYAPIPRIAFYDIGYPKDAEEFERLNGHGILLVSAMSQNASELPIAKVYAVAGGQTVELKSLKRYLSEEADPASRVVKTFGAYRADELFLFPVYLRLQRAELLVDFAQNRTGMKLAAFDGTTPEALGALPNRRPTAQTGFENALEVFIKREYPGFWETR